MRHVVPRLVLALVLAVVWSAAPLAADTTTVSQPEVVTGVTLADLDTPPALDMSIDQCPDDYDCSRFENAFCPDYVWNQEQYRCEPAQQFTSPSCPTIYILCGS